MYPTQLSAKLEEKISAPRASACVKIQSRSTLYIVLFWWPSGCNPSSAQRRRLPPACSTVPEQTRDRDSESARERSGIGNRMGSQQINNVNVDNINAEGVTSSTRAILPLTRPF